MKTKSSNFIYEAKTEWEHPAPGIKRQIMGYDGQIMMVKVVFEKDAIGYAHEHYHSQTSYVVSGKFEVMIKGEKQILSAGDGFYIEPDATHGVVCLEAGELLDVFTPMRADFIA